MINIFKIMENISTIFILFVTTDSTKQSASSGVNIISLQLAKKSFAFYETQKFTAMFTTVLHLSLSWARWINSKLSHTVSLRHILILFYNIRLFKSSKRSFFLRFSNQKPRCISSLPHACYMPFHLMLLHLITLMISHEEFKSQSSSICSFLELSFFTSLLGPNTFSTTLLLNTLSYFSTKILLTATIVLFCNKNIYTYFIQNPSRDHNKISINVYSNNC